MAKPSFEERYTDRMYTRSFSYDALDRPIRETTGARTAELMGNENGTATSAVTTTYNARGAVQSVGGSYGALVDHVHRTADDLVSRCPFSTIVAGNVDFLRSQLSHASRESAFGHGLPVSGM